MKYSIALLTVSIAISASAYISGQDDPSTITNWADKVALYRSGLKLESAGKTATPDRKPREPSAESVNLFMEGEIIKYTAAKTAEFAAAFPGVKASDYQTWKTMTAVQRRSFRLRYKAAWLEAFVGTTNTEFLAWKRMTDEERSTWEKEWSATHPGCTPFVVPALIEPTSSVTEPEHLDINILN